MKRLIKLLVVLFITPTLGFSQGSGSEIFDNSIVHEIKFSFDQSDYWNILSSNYESTPEGQKVPYLMGNVLIDGEQIDSVGVRFKGYTSYTDGNKKPIKIDFNRYVSGKKFDGLKKLNLNNGTADPSMQRDVICYDLLRDMGVKAPRTSYSKVYFNNQYWGLYQNIEQVDKTFLKNNFSNAEGNLFKNMGWSHFEWAGGNDASYHPPFELKTNEEGGSDNWSGFVNLMDVLNNSSDEDFPEAIKEVFNVDLFLKTLAVDVATNNWDSYLEHGRNWYIYEDTTTGIFNWIPWDYNLALGGDLGGGGPGGDDCQVFSYFGALTNGTAMVEFYDQSYYIGSPVWSWDFGDNSSSTMQNPVHEYATQGEYNVCLTVTLSDTCYNEYCNTINTSYNPEDCQSIVNGSCPHPADIYFVQTIEWIPACCDNWNDECEESYSWLESQGEGPGGVNFEIDQKENSGILINRLLNVPEFNSKYNSYFCDLMNYHMTEDYVFDLIDNNKELINDAIESDPNFLFSYDDFLVDIGVTSDTTKGIKNLLSKRIKELNSELESNNTCSGFADAIPWHDIVINEFVASSDSTSTILDENGESDDWIEIYNNTTSSIDLSGLYLSDDISNLNKWQFANGTTISSNGYLIVWTDKDDEQGDLHTNFKLKKSGEQLVLSNQDGSIIDSLTFGEQITNIASARVPNGTGDFIQQAPTFEYNNELVDVKNIGRDVAINIQPNPVSEEIHIDILDNNSKDYLVTIISSSGQVVSVEKHTESSFTMDVKNWSDGFYIIHILFADGSSSISKLLVSH